MRLAWRKEAHKKHRTKPDPPFILKVSPGLPQSWLDKRIFTPKWELRSDWEKEQAFYINTLNREEEYSGAGLAEIRGEDFQEYEKGKYVYKPNRDGKALY